MADSDFATLVSKDRSANAISNPIWVNLSDGTDSIAIDASGNIAAILASNDGVDIGDVTINNAAGASAVNIQDGGNSISIDDGGGSITVDGTVSITGNATDDAAFTVASDGVTVMGGLADETTPDSVDEGDQGALRMTLDRKLLTRVVGASDANRLDVDASGNAKVILASNDGVDIGDVTINNASGASAVNIQDGGNSITVDASSLDIRTITKATDSIQVSKDANANSETNPIFVQTVNTGTSGTEIHDYDTAAAVAGDGTSNHDYTVTGTTFLLKKISLASSGGSKVEVQAGPVLSLATKWVGFIPKQGGVIEHEFVPALEVPVTSTGTVRLIRTNRQGASQDLYSTIEGNDV